MILTNIGLAKFANAQVTETNVTFTQIAVGDSNGAYYNPTASMTALVHEVWRGNINAIYIDENNPNWVVCEGIIPTDVGGFMVREMGLFDDENNLLAVGKVPETYKPLLTNGSAKDLYLKAILKVSNANAVTLKIDPAVTVASRKYVDDKIQIVSTNLANVQQQLATHLDNDENPHNVTKAQVGLGNVDNVKQASKLDFDAHVLAKATDAIRPHGMGRIAGQDYEEGTFTPVIYGLTTAGTHTYNLQNGIYRKIGRSVFIAIQVRMSSKDTDMAGGVSIGGLPFVANFEAPLSIGRFDFITLDSDVNSLGALVRNASSRIEINQMKNNNGVSFLDSSKTTNGTLFALAGVYSI